LLTFSGTGLHLSIHLNKDARAAYHHLNGLFGHPT
jgi:hypothetical protein